MTAKEVDGRAFTYNLLDFTRYVDIRGSQNGSEPIEIDFSELGDEPLQCIQAHTGGGGYASYLIAMPGELLAKIYGLYGPRLLEQNVRTFLQARTKVNRGIIETISQTPEMFFAYNNGLTATASELNTARFARWYDHDFPDQEPPDRQRWPDHCVDSLREGSE